MKRLFDWFKERIADPSEQKPTPDPLRKKKKDFPNRILYLMRQTKSKTNGYYSVPPSKDASKEAPTSPKSKPYP